MQRRAVDANAFMPEFMKSYNKRFAHAPRNTHDAHRALREDENLSDIFSWQEDRKLSQNLVVQFQRDSYLVTPTPATLCFAGKEVRVHQWKDGQVEIRFDNRSLPFTLFDKSPHVTQGAIVENKHLGVVLSAIQIMQGKRDEALLASKNLTLRRKARLRAKRAEAAIPEAPDAGPTSAASAAFAAYFEVFQREQKERNRRHRTERKQRETTLQNPIPQTPIHP